MSFVAVSGLFEAVRAYALKFRQIIRYAGVGIINSAFGYGLYATFVAVYHNIYIAQITSHILGMIFNFLMLKIHVFRGATPSVARYILVYIINYIMGLGFLLFFHHFIESPYIVGFVSLVSVALINYFILKAFVFR